MKRKILGLVVFSLAGFGQDQPYKPGDFQKENPNYFKRNPFYFEGRINWNLLKIDTPKDAWEFAQRGIHRQDDLEDKAGALADYKQAYAMNNLGNGTCQLVTSTPATAADLANLTPPPCMFTVRLRMAYMIHHDEPLESIRLYKEVLEIDPLRLGVNALIAETYEEIAKHATSEEEEHEDLEKAIEYFKKELALAPVTELSIKVTGDEANNANVHWSLAHIYEELGDEEDALKEFDLFLKASKWHSNPYPWRIELAKKKLEEHQ